MPKRIVALAGHRTVAVSAAWGHSLMVTASGKVFGCGCNLYGQLGLGDKQQRLVPTEGMALGSGRAQSAAAGLGGGGVGNHGWAALAGMQTTSR